MPSLKKITEYLVQSSTSDQNPTTAINTESSDSSIADIENPNSEVLDDAPSSPIIDSHVFEGIATSSDPTGKKRIESQSPSTDTGFLLKKQTLGVLDDSFSTELRAVEQSFENQWGPFKRSFVCFPVRWTRLNLSKLISQIRFPVCVRQ